MFNRLLPALTLCALASAYAMAGEASPPAADDPSRVPPQETTQADLEMQMLVGVFSLKEFCKETDAAKSADYEASWSKEIAASPPTFKDIMAKAEFKEKVDQRLTTLRGLPDAKAQAGKVCAKMLAK